MKVFIAKNKSYLLFLLILFISELIVNPVGDFPLNDDWTYGKSVFIFKNEGRIDVGGFAAMSLFSHILWGYAFIKTFWFSFTILRFSTIVSSFIGIVFFYKLLLRITTNEKLSFAGALILLFNPLYFNLTNTFMTDVNFNTLLVLCCYFAYDYFQTSNRISFLLVFVFSLLLVLVRQFGIIVPVCFTFANLFVKEKRWLSTAISLALALVVISLFKYYESYLRSILDPNPAYKFSSDTDMTSPVFWETFLYWFKLRYAQVLLNILLYSSPLLAIYFIPLLRKINILVSLIVIVCSTWFIYFLLKDVPFPSGNVFTNMSLGAETFYETLTPNLRSPHEHTYSFRFEEIATALKYGLCSVSLSVLLLAAIDGLKRKYNPFKMKPSFLFLASLLCCYLLMIMITESYFDRYHIPIFSLCLLLFSYLTDKVQLNYIGTGVLLLLMMYCSVFGTKDYLELNRNRWKAYNDLIQNEKVDPDKINGGFEVNCWNFGKRNWWSGFMNINEFDYLIQYRKEENFKRYKQLEFQRYFPYKRDTLFVYKRDSITK